MINQTFKDIKLDAEDLQEINDKVAARDDLDAHSKGVWREMLVRDAREGIWSNRDYAESDAGEAPKGAQW